MLILDQVKKGDRPLQALSIGILTGLGILLVGLWYVQVVSQKKYADSIKVQSFRTVRVPAARGKILDRSGHILADNQPRFNVSAFLEDLRPQFTFEYTNHVKKEYLRARHQRGLSLAEKTKLGEEARFRVITNIVYKASASAGTPRLMEEKTFSDHYSKNLALPLTILTNLSFQQVASFMERAGDLPGVELEVEPTRFYPLQDAACHLLGYVKRTKMNSEDDEIHDDEEISFNYRLPDVIGKTGLEGLFDGELRGKPGVKSILVNNMGYRQKEETWSASQPGQNLYLTIDSNVQRVAFAALAAHNSDARGAAVAIDVRTGDILALVSCPSFDPHLFQSSVSAEEYKSISDPERMPQLDRAVRGNYAPGSIFKIIVGLAALEQGLDPDEIYDSPGAYRLPGRSKPIADTAGSGKFNFRRALLKSSNCYFIDRGRRVGPEKIIEMGHRFHLSQATGMLNKGEGHGYFPKAELLLKRDGSRWQDGDTANLSIGQGEIAVTPLQMALMTAAVANGGKLLRPRLIAGLASQESLSGEDAQVFPSGVIVGDINVKPEYLTLVRDAMLADVEDAEGTGRAAFVAGMRVCGKTGTAQRIEPDGHMDHTTWFVSFAPYESPLYAVAVVVESGVSGGRSCAPVAHEIFKALQKLGGGR